MSVPCSTIPPSAMAIAKGIEDLIKPTKTWIFCFTDAGEKKADQIANLLGGEVRRVHDLKKEVAETFCSSHLLIFVGALGIAVRAISPHIKSKTSDPAVLVADEKGHFVIPVLSGHLGGANEFARSLAWSLGAQAVITTATDLNGVFAVDLFARQQNLSLFSAELIKVVSSRLLHGQRVGLTSEFHLVSDLPSKDLVYLRDGQGAISGTDYPVGIHLGMRKQSPFLQTLNLVPKCLVLGAGARKGVDPKAFEAFVLEELTKLQVPREALAALATIDLKKSEAAFLAFSKKYDIPLVVYTSEELSQVEEDFESSAFVKKTTGTGNVCQAAAYLASGNGKLITGKVRGKAMTLALAQKDFKLDFSEYTCEKELGKE